MDWELKPPGPLSGAQILALQQQMTLDAVLQAALQGEEPAYTPEGYGKNVTGGAGQTVYTVTSGAATGAGTFYAACQPGDTLTNKIVQFDPSVTTFTTNTILYIGDNVTIDGLRNGCTGVIHDGTGSGKASLVLQGTNNVILRGINFRGNGPPNTPANAAYDLFSLDGEEATVSNIFIERCTFFQSSDGTVDMVWDTHDVTIQWCLFYANAITMLCKYGTRSNLSVHHNLFVANGERNPQIRGAVSVFDYCNNVVYQDGSTAYPTGWVVNNYYDGEQTDPYAIWIINSAVAGEVAGDVYCNIEGNAFIGDKAGVSIDTETGRSDAGNYLGSSGTGADNNYYNGTSPCASPRGSRNAIAAEFQVSRMAITAMKTDLAPWVGCPRRTGKDQDMIDRVVSVLP